MAVQPAKEDEMTLNATVRGAISGAILAISAAMLAPHQAAQAQSVRAKAGLALVDPRDRNAARNIANVLTPGYIQHNPLIADGSAALGKYFAGVKAAHPGAHVVVHRIIAVGDYVFAHVNFVNLLTDDPNDSGGAGVDIYRMNAEGKAVEHWDALELVGDPKNSAPWVGPNIPRANPNGMF